jgi:hypothetical protein
MARGDLPAASRRSGDARRAVQQMISDRTRAAPDPVGSNSLCDSNEAATLPDDDRFKAGMDTELAEQ